MLGIWYTITDIIFPPHENIKVVRGIKPGSLRHKYRKTRLSSEMYTLANYTDQQVRAAITANKFHGSVKAATLLAELLDQYLNEQTKYETVWLVPIPLGGKRQKERGYNQVEVVLEKLHRDDSVISKLLTRERETTPQTSLKRSERLRNMAGAFGTRPNLPTPPPGTHVVIVDDVTTTGATLKAARAALAPQLPKNITLTCLALAH